MLSCEGYKMFKGAMKIKSVVRPEYIEEGVWLYKPEYECWYCNGRSYPNENCEVVIDNTK